MLVEQLPILFKPPSVVLGVEQHPDEGVGRLGHDERLASELDQLDGEHGSITTQLHQPEHGVDRSAPPQPFVDSPALGEEVVERVGRLDPLVGHQELATEARGVH